MEQTQVYFDKTMFNAYLSASKDICNQFNNLIAELRKGDFLQIPVNSTFVAETLETKCTNIAESYEKHLEPFLNQSNKLMQATAKESAKERISELQNILNAFYESVYKGGSIRYGKPVSLLIQAIVYDSDSKVFHVVENVVKELCTTFASGDSLKLYKRIESLVADAKQLNEIINKKTNGRMHLFGDYSGLLNIDNCEIVTNYDRFIELV